jgi:uncharacterized LabA/DUF88 family protein
VDPKPCRFATYLPPIAFGEPIKAARLELGQDGRFKDRNLRPLDLVTYFDDAVITDGLGTVYKRAVFLFRQGRFPGGKVRRAFEPTMTPSLIRHVEFRFCGRKMAGSARYEEWLETVPDEFRERCQRSEKGVDIEICCDALHLAGAKLLDRPLLLTNDSDFVPLCRMLKQLRTNISLIQLSGARPVNEQLVEACDTYNVVDERHLFAAFGLSAALAL